MRDHYATLNVPRKATADEIRQAYKRLALQLHPDKNADRVQEATERFQAIVNAYEVIGNAEKRRDYDREQDSGFADGSEPPDSRDYDDDGDWFDPDDDGDESPDDDGGEVDGDVEDAGHPLLVQLRTAIGIHELLINALDPPVVERRAPRYSRRCPGCEPHLAPLQYTLTHMVSTPDVETYTGLFHHDEKSAPSQRPLEPIAASNRKGAVMYGFREGLLSRDADGIEIGYQNPDSSFNGRMPYFFEIRLAVPPSGKWIRVPIVGYHVPYGSVGGGQRRPRRNDPLEDDPEDMPEMSEGFHEDPTEEQLKMRHDSIVGLLRLGIPPNKKHQRPRPLGEYLDAIVMGDFNLDLLQEDVSPIIASAYGTMSKHGFREMIRQATSMRSPSSVLPARDNEGPAGEEQWYSSAYDNILVRATYLKLCETGIDDPPIVAGAVDVFDVMARHASDFVDNPKTAERIANPANYRPSVRYTPKGRAKIEARRYDKADPRAKAFYIYRRFISDHLPVFVDLFVTENNGTARGAAPIPEPPDLKPPRPLIGIDNPQKAFFCYLNAALQMALALGLHQPHLADGGTAIQDGSVAKETVRLLIKLERQAQNGEYRANSALAPVQSQLEEIYLDGSTKELRQRLKANRVIGLMEGEQNDAASVFIALRSEFVTDVDVSSAALATHFALNPLPPPLPSNRHFVLRVETKYQREPGPALQQDPNAIMLENGSFVKYDCLDSLELPIPKDKESVELDAILKEFFDPSHAGGNSLCQQQNANGIMEYFQGTVTKESSRLAGTAPDHLIIGLKRFAYSEEEGTISKVLREVVCPDKIQVFGRPYELKAFTYHDGGSILCGHYTAYVNKNGLWYKVDDSRVTPNPEDRADAQKAAYFYYYLLVAG